MGESRVFFYWSDKEDMKLGGFYFFFIRNVFKIFLFFSVDGVTSFLHGEVGFLSLDQWGKLLLFYMFVWKPLQKNSIFITKMIQ